MHVHDGSKIEWQPSTRMSPATNPRSPRAPIAFRCRPGNWEPPIKHAAAIRYVLLGPSYEGPNTVENETFYCGKTISTRRFCGSRTPGGVGTRRSLKL